jgi:hypothetical protein
MLATFTFQIPVVFAKQARRKGKNLSSLAADLVVAYFKNEIEEPPEECISAELIRSVEQSEQDLAKGKYTACRKPEELDLLFKKLKNGVL